MARLCPYREEYRTEAAEAEFKNVIMYGKSGSGKNYFYFRKMLTTYYVPYTDVVNAYRRVQLVSCGDCCAGDNLNMQMVVIDLKDGEAIESGLSGEKQAEILMELIKEAGVSIKAPVREKK